MNSLVVLFTSLILVAQAAHADSYYDIHNGKRYLCRLVSETTPLPSCTSECQYFDTFNNVCNYTTSCEYSNQCLTEKNCDIFDSNDRICKAEKSILTCVSDYGSSVTCTARCQHYDSFNQVCQYQSSCTIQGNCIVSKTCDRWDSFNNVCLAEKSVTHCR